MLTDITSYNKSKQSCNFAWCPGGAWNACQHVLAWFSIKFQPHSGGDNG